MQMESLSIIIATFNSEKTLEDTILSILAQEYKDIELIIIDGKSTDNTVEIIRKYQNSIHYWISEKDKGIYDAMNKGLEIAKGDWILFIGSDDCLYRKDVLQRIFSHASTSKYELVLCNILWENQRIFRSRYNPLIKIKNTMHHQGVLYNRKLYDNISFDLRYKILADYDFNLKIYLANPERSCFHFNDILSFCSHKGISYNSFTRCLQEELLIKRENLNRFEFTIVSTLTYTKFLFRPMFRLFHFFIGVCIEGI
jgi:glycosyltransferase involved in cell wall biosynthesis